MYAVRIAHPVDFDGWRSAARALRLAGVPPDEVDWRVGESEAGLFAGEPPPEPEAGAGFTAPRAVVDLARVVICHADPQRFERLYRLLWRSRATPELVHLVTDPQVSQVLAMQKAVREAEHKMHAFVRFRRVDDRSDPAAEAYFAWYEPPHFVIERGVGFFVRRLANVGFTIASPYVTAKWDRRALSLTPGGAPAGRPAEDASEEDWKAYYLNVFNPARLNPKVMTQHMARSYWPNLPEAQAIPGMIAGAQARTSVMIDTVSADASPQKPLSAARPQPPGDGVASETAELDALAAEVSGCRRCELWRHATQGVAGRGPTHARLMLVGEQPGDMEDLRGQPFVGPAGQLLDRALAQAGIARDEAFVTNAVKHFKYELRGKRRIHQKPDAGEVRACRWWLDRERAIVKPHVVVALGATAATAVFGRALSVLRNRGQVPGLDDAQGFLTVHPSYLLRLPDDEARTREFDLFVRDLAAAQAALETAARRGE